jgi:hypothetical protein
MLHRLLGHLRQNAVAWLALFVAFGGTSAWATHETILSSDIVDNEVRTADVRNDTLSGGGLLAQDLATGSVGSAEVRDDTLPPGGLMAQDLGSDSVGNDELAAGSVNTDEIQDFSIREADLRAGAITPLDFGTIPAARVWKCPNLLPLADQSVPSEQASALTFNCEDFDTHNLFSFLPTGLPDTRLFAGDAAGATGIYQVTAGVEWSPDARGIRFLGLRKNGQPQPFGGGCCFAISEVNAVTVPGRPTRQTVSGLVRLNAGEVTRDYVEAVVFQDSGRGVDVGGELDAVAGGSTFLAMHWVGPPPGGF